MGGAKATANAARGGCASRPPASRVRSRQFRTRPQSLPLCWRPAATPSPQNGKSRESRLVTIWMKRIKITMFEAWSRRPWDPWVERSRPHVPWGARPPLSKPLSHAVHLFLQTKKYADVIIPRGADNLGESSRGHPWGEATHGAGHGDAARLRGTVVTRRMLASPGNRPVRRTCPRRRGHAGPCPHDWLQPGHTPVGGSWCPSGVTV